MLIVDEPAFNGFCATGLKFHSKSNGEFSWSAPQQILSSIIDDNEM